MGSTLAAASQQLMVPPIAPPPAHPSPSNPPASPEAAAETVLYAATAPAEEVGGRYCGTAPRVTRHSAAGDDPQLAQRLWDLSAHLCQLDADDLVS